MLKKKKIKKLVFPGLALMISIYGSLAFALGLVIGYISTNLFCKKLVDTGKIKRVVLDHGNYNVIFHHWIIGLFILFVGIVTQLIYATPIFWVGCVGGLILHDLYTDKEWYKVVCKKEPR